MTNEPGTDCREWGTWKQQGKQSRCLQHLLFWTSALKSLPCSKSFLQSRGNDLKSGVWVIFLTCPPRLAVGVFFPIVRGVRWEWRSHNFILPLLFYTSTFIWSSCLEPSFQTLAEVEMRSVWQQELLVLCIRCSPHPWCSVLWRQVWGRQGWETLQGRAVLCLPGLLILLFKCWIPQVRGEDPHLQLFINVFWQELWVREDLAVLSVTRGIKKALAFRNTKLTAK